MTRTKFMRPALALALVLLSSLATAQVARRVPRGEVSGVELQIDGQLVASRSRPLRLALTTFEVLGLDRLRRAPNVMVNVYASFQVDRPVVSTPSDAAGRVLVEVPVPEDVRGSFGMVVEARSPNRVVRRFEFSVEVQEDRVLALSLAPGAVYPGSPMHVGGRLVNRVDGRALASVPVVVDVSGPRGPVVGSIRLVTDASGSFRSSFTLPTDAEVGTYTATARAYATNPVEMRTTAQVVARSAPPMLVSVAPARPIAAPRDRVELEIVVRRPDGRPVEGATVRTIPARADEVVEGRTDARGHVRLEHRLGPGTGDTPVAVTVDKAGIGSARGGAMVRVATAGYFARLSFEGGRFASALGGRAYARVVAVDGRPAPAGVPVVFSGPRLRGAEVRAVTDAEGVAVAELAIGPVPRESDEVSDSCGGTIATEITANVGDGRGSASRCLLLDPDGVVRVRTASPRVRAGAPIVVRVDRAAAASRAPVVLELVDLSSAGGRARGSVLAHALVAATSSEASLAVPADAVGLLGVRARLLTGDGTLEVRGATATVMSGNAAPFEISGRYDRELGSVQVDFAGEPGESTYVSALALPYDVAVGIVRGYDPASQIAALPSQTADDVSHGDAWLVASLADAIPDDDVAAHAYLDGAIAPTPGPEDPGSAGRLRDPYRARARFVEGRLGLLFRALEDFVDESVPGAEAQVMHVEGGRFVLNDAVLSAVASEGDLGAEGATGLGGDPITIAQLRTIDPSFDYDAVARRVTRVRLFQLLLSLRSFVNAHGFDLAWARPGDPRVWLESMVEEGAAHADTDSLVDAWGRPFQLVPTTRPRFALLQPVVGFEVVSAGPDGRYGNGDDVFDPTARVLAQNGVYARSVREDALVARLRGVELSRATLAQVSDLFGVYVSSPGDYGGSDESSRISLPSPSFPPILVADPEPLAVRRVGRTIPSRVIGPILRDGAGVRIPIDLGSEPRSWGIVVYAQTASGGFSSTLVRATTGTGILGHGELPSRLSVRAPSTLELAVTNVSATPRSLRVRPTSCDGTTIEVPDSLELGPQISVPLRVVLRAATVGRCESTIDLLDGDHVVASFARTIDVDSGAHPERRRVAALVGSESTSLDVAPPDDASRATGRLTIVDASSFVELPEVAAGFGDDPSLLAWSRVQVGRPFGDALRDRVIAAHWGGGQRSSLSRALASIALSARVDDAEAASLRSRLIGGADSFGSDAVRAADAESGHRRMASAVVAAFAITGTPDPDAERYDDPVAQLFGRLVPELRRSVRVDVASPVGLAFPAAALLLVDSHDGHGRALYDRVLAVSTKRGDRRSLPSAEGREPSEASIAELAMAVAAHELGREAEALEFARHAFASLPAIARSSEDGAFWLAALSVYGTLAHDGVTEVDVSVRGRSQRVRLDDGRAVVDVPVEPGSRSRISVRSLSGAWVVAEAEVAYERPFVAETNGPISLAIDGDPGRGYGVAALELTLTTSEPVFDPVVELALPSCVVADDVLLASLRGAPGVRSVELRAAGFLRIALQPMLVGQVKVPLPLSFQAIGSVTGLAASAYPASDAYRRSVLPPRTFVLAE